ncbi:hypothetical protein [Holospora curviuscula]|uniref:Uncharacterized protein n=1 Tax=Holospora curviuscula TaxID=1082868 RepID=A0A2S5RA45_9PROT|nr:hypothetical protein [Holospora curviuscula]PPE04204.1 hypothetical protein HCUR_00395 [Holospora curviuscula]
MDRRKKTPYPIDLEIVTQTIFFNLWRIIVVKDAEINALADEVDLSYSLDSLLK